MKMIDDEEYKEEYLKAFVPTNEWEGVKEGLIDTRKESPKVDKAIREGLDVTPPDIEEVSPVIYKYRVDYKVYPFKCPHCKALVAPPQDKVYIQKPFPVGMTKSKFSKKKKPRRAKTQATLQGTESY